MNEISCEICMDLIPLVWDGVASGDSRAAVVRHTASCEACRAVYEKGNLPEADAERALTKAVKRVQAISAAVIGVLVLLGICLCELVMQGSSLLFLLAAAGIGWLLRTAFSKKDGKRGKRIAAFLAAVALVCGLGWGFNEIFGNPIAKGRAETLAREYVAEQYPGLELAVEEADYEMKSTTYRLEVWSETSVDTRFTVVIRDGKVLYDTYEEAVEDRVNTLDRISGAYSDAALPVLKLIGLECDIYSARAELSLGPEDVELDGAYDAVDLGTEYGVLDIMLGNDTVTEERAAELLLNIKNRMDEEGIGFASIDFELRRPKNKDNPNDWRGTAEGGTVVLKNFPCEAIYAEGLAERICEANLDDEAYHASGK